MSFTWPQIHEHLLRSSSTLGFQRDFDAIRRKRELLSPFRDPAALIDALHRGAGTPDEKNLVLTLLIEVAQSDEPEANCALTLMLLALWPALEGALRRLTRRRAGPVDELASEVLARATEAIRGLVLGRVNRIAATIVRNVERDIVRMHQREVDRQRLHVETDPDKIAVENGSRGHTASPERLHVEIARLIGADASIVIRVAVDGFSQAEVGVELGLSEAAARKRYQRATARLRDALHESA